MPRKPRIDFDGAWHHVMNRDAGRRVIFEADSERDRFLNCLVVACQRYAVEVHGYCLLSNHYHLLVRSRDGRLSAAMSWLSSRYTQSLNYEKDRDGPLFRGRFASVPIDGDAHLMQSLRYIHLNPVRAGLASKCEAWPWSSASAYAGVSAKPNWLHTEALLEMFSPNARLAGYRALIDKGLDGKTIAGYEKFMMEHGVRPAGSDPGMAGDEGG